MVTELLSRGRLEKLLRDSFANYVVQTALDYAEPNQRQSVSIATSFQAYLQPLTASVFQLVDHIRPILPMIRNTPYGKRIQSKLQRESQGNVQDHFGGAVGGFPGQNSVMNLGGMNNFGSGGFGGGRGGFQSHRGHNNNHNNQHGHNMHHNGMNNFYGQNQGQGMGMNQGMGQGFGQGMNQGMNQGMGQGMGFGGYQGAMGGGYDTGFGHLGQQPFGGPQFGQGQGGFGASGNNDAFGAAAFAQGPVDQPDVTAHGNNLGSGLPNMGLAQMNNATGIPPFQPQQAYAQYM